MENKIYMLSTQSCTKCPVVKQALSTKNVEVEYVDVEKDPEIAIQVGAMSVPTIVDNREGHETTFVGQQQALEFVNTLG